MMVVRRGKCWDWGPEYNSGRVYKASVDLLGGVVLRCCGQLGV